MVVLVAANRLLVLGDLLGNRQLGNRPAPLLVGVVPGVQQDQEDMLGPAEVLHVGGGQFPVPVVAEAEHLELAAEVVDVFLGRLPGGGPRAFRVLFGGQSEGVPAHRVHHARPAHPLVAADNIGGRVPLRMADVEPVAARVGEHVEDVELAPLRHS